MGERLDDELWPYVLEFIVRYSDSITAEPRGRDRGRIDETFAELYLLGERPSVEDIRTTLADLGAPGAWANEVVSRWRMRLAKPGWRPTTLRGLEGRWVRPFCLMELAVAEYGLRAVPDRLANAVDCAARDYLTRAVADPASASASDEGVVFGLTAGAVRLWALVQDAVDDMPWPSVMSCALERKDNLAAQWTKAGRERQRAKLERWRAELDDRLRSAEADAPDD